MGHEHRRDRRGTRLFVIGASCAGVLWGGCSLERDRAILSFFFDGVPQPVTPDSVTGGAVDRASGGAPARRTVSAHTAYVERRCAECHGESARFGLVTTGFEEITESACVACHAEITAGVRLHGPIAAGECLPCHRPHFSSFPKLLRNEPQSLCLSCHGGELHDTEPGSWHGDPNRNCLECHESHGGADRYFLRPSWSRAGGAVEAE